MMAPFDRYLKSLNASDTQADKMRKLLAAYNLRKQGGGFVSIRKQDDDLDLDDDDIDDLVELDRRA